MKLDTLKSTSKTRARKRVGRGDGSGSGTTCGRGTKGAGARSGHSQRLFFEGGQIPFIRRIPKRGFKNPNHKVMNVINVGLLAELFNEGEEVTKEMMRGRGLLAKKLEGVKVLGTGEISFPLTVKADAFSESARKKIEAAGGTVVEG
jgi:large subunit ribosomal protein L15